jgi:hypothetical protein
VLSESSLRAMNLIERGSIVPKPSSFDYLFWDVAGREVCYDIRKKRWSCDCIHESWRTCEKDCCLHIKAVQWLLNAQGGDF